MTIVEKVMTKALTAPPFAKRMKSVEEQKVMVKAMIVTPAAAKRELPPRPIRRIFPSWARDILLLTTSNSSMDLVDVMMTMMTSERNTAVAVKMAATEDMTAVATVTGTIATSVQKQSKGHGGSRLEDYGEDNYGDRSSYCPNDSGNETLNTERLCCIHDHGNKYREDGY